MDSPKVCTKERREIIESNDYLTHQRAHQEEKMLNTEAVQLVARYAKESTQECIRLYSEKLRDRYIEVGETVTERAHQYADTINILGDIVDQRLKKTGHIVYELLEKFSYDDPDKMYMRKVTNARTGYKELNEVKL